MFLPTTKEELSRFGWDALDIILVTGDAYIDSPYIGIAVIGNYLVAKGYRVGVIAQPDIDTDTDITRLGEPKLFWGVSSGSVDSMVANYTALKKRRRSDDYTPGGVNDKRPDRAVIAYANLIKQYFKNTAPIVLGGIEASLRRISHYDYWSDKIRRSILFDAKADYLIYGMGERAALELTKALKAGKSTEDIRGLCYIAKEKREGYLELPFFTEAQKNDAAFAEAFELFYKNNDPLTAKGLYQLQDSRYLVQNPPALPLSTVELDTVSGLDYVRDAHPYYLKRGKIKAIETIRFSITTHRGCYGECSFCAIALHQGRAIQSRSHGSVIAEAKKIAALPDFKGYIDDVGGPTANMYDYECEKKMTKGTCVAKPCIGVTLCDKLLISHGSQIQLLKKLRSLPGVKKVFVRSGIRYDLILADKAHGKAYLEEIVSNHVSGQLKVAPEHSEDKVLELMNKPKKAQLIAFKKLFDAINKRLNKRQFLTYYFIAAHPGCSYEDMKKTKAFTSTELKISPEQIQVFTPTPSTVATLMYKTGRDRKGNTVFVEKDTRKKAAQKDIFTSNHRKNTKPHFKDDMD